MKPIALIVDDHPVNRQVLHAALEPLAQVHEAADGVEALEQIAKLGPNVVFLDIMMPRLDGYGVIRELKDNNPDMLARVVVVTARTERETCERVMADGVSAFLPKPVLVRDILTQFQRIIEQLMNVADTPETSRAAGGD